MAEARRNTEEPSRRILDRTPACSSEVEERQEDSGSDGDSGVQPPSPFIPGTHIQWAWDSTSLDWFKRCPRLYQYCMIEGWRATQQSVHLTFGIAYHEALQHYDICKANGMNHEDSLEEVISETLRDTADWSPDPEEKYKNRHTLLRTIIWYLDQFADDPAKTVIRDDGEPACEVNFKFQLDWGPNKGPLDPDGNELIQHYALCGYLDRVVNFNDELFVMDRKTTKSTPGAYYFNQFEPNNQMSLYTLAGQVIFGTTIKGVIIDSAQVTIEFSRFTRGLTYRTKDQIEEWLADLRWWLAKAEEHAIEGYWPQNDTACDKYGGCAFREVCSKSPNVREVYLKSNFKREPWNPLIPRQ